MEIAKKKKTKATTKKRKLLIIMIEVFQRSSNYKSRKHTVLERQIINQVSYLSSITFRCSPPGIVITVSGVSRLKIKVIVL